jgi:tetratricopeptide (TPR) repeat protein
MGRRERNNAKKVEYLTKAIQQKPTRAAFYMRGWAYEGMNRLNKALQDFDRALEAPDHPNPNYKVAKTYVHSSLCYAYYRSGKYEQSIQHGDKSLALFNQNPMALRFRGWSHLHEENYEQAEQDFDRYVALKPEDPHRYFQRSILYNKQGSYDKALEDINQAMELADNTNNNYREQKALILTNLDRADEAEMIIKDIVKFKQDDPISLANIGSFYVRNQDYKTGLKYYNKAIELHEEKIENNPGYSQEHEQDLYQIYLSRGDAYMGMQEYPKALSSYNNAQSVRSDHHLVHCKIGAVQSQQRNFEAAVRAYEKCFKIKPDFQQGWINLGFAYGELEKPKMSIRTYERALKIDNVNSRGLLYNNLGFTHLELDHYDKAKKYLKKAIEADPTIPMSHISLGEYFIEVEQYEQAIEKFNYALEMPYRNPRETLTAYYKRGLAYLEQGDLQQAIQDLETAVDVELGHVEKTLVQATETLARAYLENGELCKARNTVKRAEDLDYETEFKHTEKTKEYMKRILAKDQTPCD